MNEKKYFTAVFQVADQEQFMFFAKQVSAAMFGEPNFHGASVTGCGWGDSMSEAGRASEFLNQNGFDAEGIMRGDA